MPKKVICIGAGPGGLTASMILAHRGYNVEIFETEDRVGGRNRSITLGKYTFDTGPTFLMMTFILREMFRETGRKAKDYLDIVPLEPMYQLNFTDNNLSVTSDHKKMKQNLEAVFPGSGKGFEKFLKKEKKRYEMLYPCLQKEYGRLTSFADWSLAKAVPYLSLTESMFTKLGSYFKNEMCRISFTFQAKYLGMSPWQCPGLFTIIPYVEHGFGIDHVTGGLSNISEAMAKVVQEEGGKLHLNTEVDKVLVSNGKATGVKLKSGDTLQADVIVLNADFGHAMSNLFEPGVLRKYSSNSLSKKKYSCSTFMLYLGLDKLYDEPHHQIIIANDYKANIDDIVQYRAPSDDLSVYVRNASITDKTLAPQGHSAIYILVPVANNRSNVQWDEEFVRHYRQKVLSRIAERTSMKDIEEHIVEEEIITPDDWEQKHNVYLGATFNLGHQLSQMLYLRPRNRFEEIKNCYLVGGGTHPGSGLPTIYESGRISSDLICQDIKN